MSRKVNPGEDATDTSPLYKEDWHFDEVPEEEIIACCLWEYAKESSTIFNYEKFKTNFWKTDFPLMDIYSEVTENVGEDARAWQKLPSMARSSFAKLASKNPCLAPLKHATVGELEHIWNAHRAGLEEARARTTSVDDDSEMFASGEETRPLDFPEEEPKTLPGTMGAAFTIDFLVTATRKLPKPFGIGW